jgi:hypothetical protein
MGKPKGEWAMINRSFFVQSPDVVGYITDDATTWERELLERIAKESNLVIGWSSNGLSCCHWPLTSGTPRTRVKSFKETYV